MLSVMGRNYTETIIRKGFCTGTHRIRTPLETVKHMAEYMPAMGITRIANVTGLDRIGVPVVSVYRPNSRSVAVAQGKGTDLQAAAASGLMESIETWHAERITLPLIHATYDEMRLLHSLIPVDDLPLVPNHRFHGNFSILWIESYDLLKLKPYWIPYELVHTNYTSPMPSGSGCFYAGSNGLASGNHLLEAIIHGICEVIERDAVTLWRHAPAWERRIDLGTVTDADCLGLLKLFRQADLLVGVWDITTGVGVPTFFCWLAEQGPYPLLSQPTMGAGCHPVREIALSRALTEAAQERLTIISGARDDLHRTDYEAMSQPLAVAQERVFGMSSSKNFTDGISWRTDSLNDDLAWLLARLEADGIEHVLVVDLTRADLQIPVVRVVIPGMETPCDGPSYVPGKRALRGKFNDCGHLHRPNDAANHSREGLAGG
jgi:YcaO-like protein with predicted kinase domain